MSQRKPGITAAKLVSQVEKELSARFEQIEETAFFNQHKILQAFRENRVSEEHFGGRTGYAIDDAGRDTLDRIFADIVGADSACVRMQFVSGTHAIACAILGNIKPGEKLVCLTGRPYDTLEPVLGSNAEEPEPGSLKYLGCTYIEIDAMEHLKDRERLRSLISEQGEARIYHIQKSRGYSPYRKTYSNCEIGTLIRTIRELFPSSLVIVDNCYGELVERDEPTAHGADLIVGSLIKNPGGGLAIAGAYIAGRSASVERALSRLSAPGIKGHIGHHYGQGRLLYQGLFLAPTVVAAALKGAALIGGVFEKLGFSVSPGPHEERFDIIQSVQLGSAENLINFCRALQHYSPVDAHVQPEPAEMPGYADKVIMAGGTFVEGSTIEFSADAPLRPPYCVFAQGGLSYTHVKCSLSGALDLSLSGELPFHLPPEPA